LFQRDLGPNKRMKFYASWFKTKALKIGPP
jgi:hypothetical protein